MKCFLDFWRRTEETPLWQLALIVLAVAALAFGWGMVVGDILGN